MEQERKIEKLKKQDKKEKTNQKIKNQNKLNVKKLPSEYNQQTKVQKIKQYFNKLSGLKPEESQIVNKMFSLDKLHQNIQKNIINGIIIVPKEIQKLQNLLKPLQEQIKVTQAQMQMYQKQAKRMQHLKLIACLNKQLKNKSVQEQIPYILTKQEHQRKVSEFIQEKRKRQIKIKQLKIIMKQKQQAKYKQEIDEQTNEKNKKKQKKKHQIIQKIMKQKEEHIHFLSQQIKLRKDYQQVANIVPLHIKMQEKFRRQIQIPELQKRKRQYSIIRQFKQRYSLDNIKQHQSLYLSRKTQQLQQSKISLKRKIINNIKFPQKSQKLQNLLAQQIRKNRMIWTERDRYIEQKIKRQQNYMKKIKEQHQPKVDQLKKNQIELRLKKQKENLQNKLLQRDVKKIGLQYLGQVKKAAKRIKQYHSQSLDQYPSQILTPSKPLIRYNSQISVDLSNNNNDFMVKIRQKKLQKLLNSEQDPQNKYQKLRIQSRKLQQIKQRKLGFLKYNYSQNLSKQASNLALNTIKAKINMLQLIKNQQRQIKQ